MKENDVIEEWYYDLNYNVLYYRNNIKSYELGYTSLDSFKCINGECNNINEYELFFKILQEELTY